MHRRELLVRALLVVGVLVIGIQGFALEGRYEARGWNPGVDAEGPPSYRGIVTIREISPAVYQVDWTVGPQRFGGVGYFDVSSGTFTVGYADLGAGWFGLIWYRFADGFWVGQWAVYGDPPGLLGTEVLTEIDQSSPRL